jgi:tetratricopeptide (TPR) repeat protein
VARIYVSSTYADLKEHREKVYRVLRQLKHDAVAMEDYVSTDQRPLTKCLEDVASCDLYIGILARRYGYIPDHDNPDRRSITELEYRHAQALGIPQLVFLLDEATSWPLGWTDASTGDGDHGARIRALREELGRDRVVSFFATVDQLGQQVSVAVTNQLAYQLVKGLPPIPAGRGWTIPPPVRSFTGRNEMLTALHGQLTSQGAATLVPSAALTGMGGVGKTQLALAYAQRHRAQYQLGWWVPAETELGMLTALANLGIVLGLPAALPPAELATEARNALAERSRWLVIFDNAPDPASVAEFLPAAGGGHVLVTSRDSAWHGIADPVPVDLLPVEAAVRLLLRRSGDTNKLAAAQVAEALGRLPLALEQAAAYAAEQHLPLADYFRLFERRRGELLARGKPLAYDGTVDATFSLTLDQLRRINLPAVRLVEMCALLAPDEIPIALLLSDPALLPDVLATAAKDELVRSELIGVLYRTGLMARDVAGTARIHRLVQDVALAHLPDIDRRQRTFDMVVLLAKLLPYPGDLPDGWSRSAQLLPHVQTLLHHAHTVKVTSPAMANLLSRTANYLWGRKLDLRLAHELHEDALAMRQRLYNGDHPDVANSLNNVALILSTLGKYGRARDLHEQALAMRRRLYGGDHLHVASSCMNLAIDLRRLGENQRARELDEQALAMFQRLYPEDHPYVVGCMSNLASDLLALGEYEGARELDEQALAMRQRLYGDDHPEIATSMNNLAIALRAAGEHGRARDLNEQALAMRQRLYGGDHPEIATSMHNLSIVMRDLGERAETRPVRGIGQSGTALRRIPPAVVVGGGGRARAGGPAGRGSPAASPPGNPRHVL